MENNSQINLEQYSKIKNYVIKLFENDELEVQQESIKILNTHFYLYNNAHQLAHKYFKYNTIFERLKDFDHTTGNSILQDENYGPIENRANLSIEFILDKIILGVDQSIKEDYEKDQQNELICIPIVEYGTNIFPDLNLFMLFPSLDIPQKSEQILEELKNNLQSKSEDEFLLEIEEYFKEAWPLYSQNVIKMIEKFESDQAYKPDEILKQQFYIGEEGQCYPSQKRNPINSKQLDI